MTPATEIPSPLTLDSEPRSAWRDWMSSLGPGLVFALAGLGPRDLVSNSIAGAGSGTSLLWVIAVSVVARAVLLDAMGRYVIVTGETIMTGVGRLGRWVALAWFGSTMLRQHARALIRLMLLGTGAHFVCPLPTKYSVTIWGLASWVLAAALMYFGKYKAIERVFKPIALAIGACMVLAAILSRPDLGAIASGILHPALPPETGAFSPVVVLMVLVSGALGGGSNIKYPAYVHEKGWRTPSFLRTARMDLIGSMAGLFIVLSLLQVAAMGALQPRGLTANKIEDLIPMFSQVLGSAGQIAFGLTLWFMAFSQHTGSGNAYGILVADVYHRFIRRSAEMTGGEKTPGEMPAYRWLVIYLSITPVYVFLTNWTPIGVVLFGGLLSIVTLPVLTVVVFLLTNDRGRLGEYTNGWITNFILILTFLSSLYLSWESTVELLRDLKKG